MFVWTSGFQNPLVHTEFNMFVIEQTAINKIREMLATTRDHYKGNVSKN